MDTVTVAITLPTGTVSPEAFQAAIHAAISAQTSAGNMIAATTLGNLLSVIPGTPISFYHMDGSSRWQS